MLENRYLSPKKYSKGLQMAQIILFFTTAFWLLMIYDCVRRHLQKISGFIF